MLYFKVVIKRLFGRCCEESNESFDASSTRSEFIRFVRIKDVHSSSKYDITGEDNMAGKEVLSDGNMIISLYKICSF